MPVSIAQVLDDGGIVALLLARPLQPLDRLVVLAEPVIGPAHRIGDGAVIGPQLGGALQHLHAGIEIEALVDPAIAEIVQHVGLLGRELERLLHVGFGPRPLLGALQHDAAAEIDRPVALLDLLDALQCGVVGGDGIGVAFLVAQQLGQGQGGVDPVRLLGHQDLELLHGVVEALLLGVERGSAQTRLPVQRRGRADLVVGRHRPGRVSPLLVEAGDGEPGEVVLGPELDGELLEDQRQVAALVARIGIQRAADLEHDLGDARGGRRRLGHRRVGREQAVHHHGIAILVAEGLEDCARIGLLAEAPQAVGGNQHHPQRRGIELDRAAVLRFGGGLVARHLVDLRVDHHDRRLGIDVARLELGERRAGRCEILLAGLQPCDDEVAQRPELVLPADAADLLLGGAIVALLDLLDRHDEVEQPVVGPCQQELRRELCRGVETAGIDAQPEGAVGELEIARGLGEGQIQLLGAGLVIMVLLGDAAGEVAAAERDRGELAAGWLRLALLRAAAGLGLDGERKRKQECRRQQREGNGTHRGHRGLHMLG